MTTKVERYLTALAELRALEKEAAEQGLTSKRGRALDLASQRVARTRRTLTGGELARATRALEGRPEPKLT